MPRADQTSQAEPPGATSFDRPRDLSHEENLAAALSSFLSQLNSSSAASRLVETVDVTDSAGTAERGAGPSPAGPSFPPIARSQGLKRVLPAGALDSSLYVAPVHPAPHAPGAGAGPAAAQAPSPAAAQAPSPVVAQGPAAAVTPAPERATERVPGARSEPPPGLGGDPVALPTLAPGPVVAGPRKPAPEVDGQADIYPERAAKRAHWLSKTRQRAEAVARPGRSYHRPLVAGAVAVVVLAATTIGITVAWERAESNDLNVRTEQLAALASTLASTRTSLTAQAQRALTLQAELRDSARQFGILKGQLVQAEDQLDQTRAELSRAQQQLSQAQSQVSLAQARADRAQDRANQAQARAERAQGRADQAQSQARQAQVRTGRAQGQARQAQGQLSHTQLVLSATQAHAALCQQGVALGQQSEQLLTELVSLENAYLTAAEAQDGPRMRDDLGQMQGLDAQAEALGPRFSASVQRCASGG